MNSKVNPIPEGYQTVTPSLTLKDSVKALEFYKKAFGAEVLCVMPAPDGKRTMHATMKIGNSILMMGDEMPSSDCPKSAETTGSSPISLYVYVPDVDAFCKRAIEAGAIQTMPVADMFWGDRCGGLNDRFGYSWMIATHNRELTPDEINEGAKAFMAQAGKK